VQSDTVTGEAPGIAAGPQSSVAEPTALKTLSFLSLASVNDFGFGYLFGGLATGGAMVVANFTTGWELYYLHETAWATSGHVAALPEDTTALRTASFTVVNSARIFGLGLLITGNPIISGGFVVVNAVGDAAAYVVTDKLWPQLSSGMPASESVPQPHVR